MKVTAFHVVNKVEEAAQSYFSNSLLFGSRKIETSRTVDFRKGRAGLQFFLQRDGEEPLCMGGLELDTVKEEGSKVAFQCRYTILPSGHSDQVFLLMPLHREPYGDYVKLVEQLRKCWEKDMQAYLPLDDAGLPILPEAKAPVDPDDEYEGLSAEEIEAITGERPTGRSSPPEETSFPPLDEDTISILLGRSAESPPAQASDESPTMTPEEIEALAAGLLGTEENDASSAHSTPSTPSDTGDDSIELSAEDIWKQITGG